MQPKHRCAREQRANQRSTQQVRRHWQRALAISIDHLHGRWPRTRLIVRTAAETYEIEIAAITIGLSGQRRGEAPARRLRRAVRLLICSTCSSWTLLRVAHATTPSR